MTKDKGGNELKIIRSRVSPTKERRKQNGGLICEIIPSDTRIGSSVKRYKAVWECPLDVYRDKKIINGTEYKAGLRFHRVYYGAILCRRSDFRPANHSNAWLEPTKSEKILNQVHNILPREDLNAVTNVCGHSKPVWGPRALESLRRGLGHLAVHWHMAAIEVCEHKRKPT